MRLIDTRSIELVEFAPNEIPNHAILSHTWGDEEVLFADIRNRSFKHKKGYPKLQQACAQAKRNGYEYIWVDTCCIDKSSSADLSEAINSMYRWYENADVCYAYLSDVATATDKDIENARWFTRGWTLQELLAPANLIFFASDWTKLGEKTALTKSLSNVTNIDEDILANSKRFDTASVAKRMSWAARRNTTRPEDAAYCLMGLFSVNMPMLYGEGGERAFLRLQEEIMKQSDDHSLFAWFDKEAPDDSYYGLLAKSPSQFAGSSHFLPYRGREPKPPYQMTNRGLQIDLYISWVAHDLFLAFLDCLVPPTFKDSTFVGLYLKKIAESDDQYARVKVRVMKEMTFRTNMKRIYVPQFFSTQLLDGIYPQRIFHLRKSLSPVGEVYPIVDILSLASNEREPPPGIPVAVVTEFHKWIGYGRRTRFAVPKSGCKLVAAIVLKRNNGELLAILLGSIDSIRVGFDALLPPEGYSNEDLWELLSTNFNPKESGSTITLEYQSVSIFFEPQVYERRKYFLVDMKIELQPRKAKSATMSGAATTSGEVGLDKEKMETKALQNKRHWWKGRV